MRKFDVQIALEGVREAREKWFFAHQKFNTDVDFVMTRLLHEAARNFMSVDEVARMSALTPKRVRELMRRAGLDPKSGKRLLAKQAAEALAQNSELLGIEPHEMDLTSPLAYLPMGQELKQQLIDARVHRVTELPDEVSGNDRDSLATAIYAGGDEPEWLTTVDGSPNAASYELADRVLALRWM